MVQRHMLEASPAILNHITPPPRGDQASAIAVYKNAYRLRLTEFLANDYEKLRIYVGEVRFNAMASAYMDAHPSRQANARWFGQNLPAFLKNSDLFAQHAECIELAELELALATAFDAPDITSLGPGILADLVNQDVSRFRFTFHPSLQTLIFQQNTVSLWSAMQCGEPPPRPHAQDKPQTIAVWRQSNQSRLRILGEEETMALAGAQAGLTFGALCEAIAFAGEGADVALRAATYLRTWLEAEIITSFQV